MTGKNGYQILSLLAYLEEKRITILEDKISVLDKQNNYPYRQ
jgi:hypothetical protein